MAANLRDPGSIPGGDPKRFQDSSNYVFYNVGEYFSSAADTHLATNLTCKERNMHCNIHFTQHRDPSILPSLPPVGPQCYIFLWPLFLQLFIFINTFWRTLTFSKIIPDGVFDHYLLIGAKRVIRKGSVFNFGVDEHRFLTLVRSITWLAHFYRPVVQHSLLGSSVLEPALQEQTFFCELWRILPAPETQVVQSGGPETVWDESRDTGFAEKHSRVCQFARSRSLKACRSCFSSSLPPSGQAWCHQTWRGQVWSQTHSCCLGKW